MIRGVVTEDYDAIVRLVVIGSRGQKERIEAVVDTGFDGWLSLPLSMIRDLELPWFRRGRASLADGSESCLTSTEAHWSGMANGERS